jgi:PAS domain S-box-containing protein
VETSDVVQDLFRTVDEDGIISDCNVPYAEILGYYRGEAISMYISDHHPKDELQKLNEIVEKTKKTNDPIKTKIKLERIDGSTCDALITSTAQHDKNGQWSGTSDIILDLSKLEYMKEMVKEIKYESLYENSPDLYRTINVRGIILDCNKSYAEKLGLSKEEVIGSHVIEHTADDHIETMLQHMQHWKKTGEEVDTEIFMKPKNGNIFPVSLSGTNLFDEKERLIGRNVVIKDISELHKKKKEMDELAKVDKLKEEFLSMITHELKSPLTPVIGFAQALMKPKMLGELSEQQTDAVATILSNATRLKKLIGDLLDAHKLDLGKMKFEHVEVNVSKMMENIASGFRYTTQEKNIKLENDTKGEIVLKSDKERIEQVITNIIYNAIDFVPKDSGSIIIAAENKGKHVLFRVVDNGPGIPIDKQRNLFHKFYQADTSVSRKHGGTGLGLSICKGVVNGLGGKIWVLSELEKGTTFYFTIPKEKES